MVEGGAIYLHEFRANNFITSSMVSKQFSHGFQTFGTGWIVAPPIVSAGDAFS